MTTGFTIWLTGLPCSGKSTLARALGAALKDRGCAVEILDGDEVREHLSRGLGFSRADRDENIRRIGYVARLLSRNGVATIVAAVSPYRGARAEVRAGVERFVEVFVKCPVEVCIQRDVKGLYKRALEGQLANMTGIADPYEEPLQPDLVVATDQESVDACLTRILNSLEAIGYVTPAAASRHGR